MMTQLNAPKFLIHIYADDNSNRLGTATDRLMKTS